MLNTSVPNWIALTLTNLDTLSADSTDVPLFKLPNDFSTGASCSSGFYNEVTDVITSGDLTEFGTWSIRNLVTGGVIFLSNDPFADIDALITALNANTDAVWSYIEVAPLKYRPFTIESGCTQYTDLKNSATAFTIQVTTNVIVGSTAQVEVESGLTYNELTAELNNGTYTLPCLNVYANNFAQALRKITIDNKDVNGSANKTHAFPALDPMVQQFARENIQIDFSPLAARKLSYELGKAESVRLIIKFRRTELIEPVNWDKIDAAINNMCVQKLHISPPRRNKTLLTLAQSKPRNLRSLVDSTCLPKTG